MTKASFNRSNKENSVRIHNQLSFSRLVLADQYMKDSLKKKKTQKTKEAENKGSIGYISQDKFVEGYQSRKPWRNVALLAWYLRLVALFYTIQDHLPNCGTIHGEQDSHQSLIKKCPIAWSVGNLVETFSQLRFLLPDNSSLCHVNNNINKTKTKKKQQ